MSMSDRDGFIWYDGRMVPWREKTNAVEPVVPWSMASTKDMVQSILVDDIGLQLGASSPSTGLDGLTPLA